MTTLEYLTATGQLDPYFSLTIWLLELKIWISRFSMTLNTMRTLDRRKKSGVLRILGMLMSALLSVTQ